LDADGAAGRERAGCQLDAASVRRDCRQVASRRRGAGGTGRRFSTRRIVAALTRVDPPVARPGFSRAIRPIGTASRVDRRPAAPGRVGPLAADQALNPAQQRRRVTKRRARSELGQALASADSVKVSQAAGAGHHASADRGVALGPARRGCDGPSRRLSGGTAGLHGFSRALVDRDSFGQTGGVEDAADPGRWRCQGQHAVDGTQPVPHCDQDS